jgi:hypothetical protein
MRLIDADALKKDWSMANKREECPQDARQCQYEQDFSRMDICEMLDEAPTVSGWISVNDRMPENAKHPGAFCPRYLVYTDYGITEGWYNPDMECWYGILTFMIDSNELNVRNIDLERGDVPKRVKNLPVKYWMPLPEPPKEGEFE